MSIIYLYQLQSDKVQLKIYLGHYVTFFMTLTAHQVHVCVAVPLETPAQLVFKCQLESTLLI